MALGNPNARVAPWHSLSPLLDRMLARMPRLAAAVRTPAQRMRLGLNVGIVLSAGSLGWALAGLASVWIEATLVPDLTPPPVARAQAPAPRIQPMSAFDPIFSANVFHARRSTTSGPGATATAPLRLTLTGTFRIGSVGFALIVGSDGKTEEVFRVGECIPRNEPPAPPQCPADRGRLTRVEHDRITVDFGGRPTVYVMEANTAIAGQPAPNVPETPASGTPAAFAQNRTGNTIEMRLPAAEVEKAFENFSEIVRQALVVPFTKDGATVGFQIQRIQPGSVFQRLGLQNQDVIKGVNGQAITTADQALRLFTLFRNERRVMMDVDRGTDALRLSYIIE
jgi:hypothetical protein